MKSTDRLSDVTVGEALDTLKKLGIHGVTPDDLKEVRRSKSFAKNLARLIHAGKLELDESLTEARKVLGPYYFGPRDWMIHFGIKLPEEVCNKKIPWPKLTKKNPRFGRERREEQLKHFVFLAPFKEITDSDSKVLDFFDQLPRIEVHAESSRPDLQSAADYDLNNNIKEPKDCHWCFMPLKPSPRTRNRTYAEQKMKIQEIDDNYKPAYLLEEVLKVSLFYQKNGKVPYDFDKSTKDFSRTTPRCKNFKTRADSKFPTVYAQITGQDLEEAEEVLRISIETQKDRRSNEIPLVVTRKLESRCHK